MKVKPVLALPEGLEVTDIEMIDEVLTITAVSTQVHPCCPLCSTPALRVHSRYTRQITDLPCSGQQVRLLVQVRKCFCQVPDCARKIFMERLTPFVQPWARVTQRLYQIVQILGLATGGRLGIRVTDRLGIQTTRQTILRRIMALPTEPVGPVSELGIDDFAFRRGRKFGTILVDMQSHKVLDLLPDRKAETAKAWMILHPEIDLVSRDRGGDYAAGAREGAPQATQVADRFHIYKNLTEAVELSLARCRAEIRKNAEAASCQEVSPEARQALVESTKAFPMKTWKPTPDPCTERARLTRRAQRYDRYQQVVALHVQGFEQAEIARRVGLSTRTIQKWLKAGTFPEAKRRRKRQSKFDPYASYVLKRWKEGCKNGSQLYREIKEKGYTGTERQVHRFLLPLRAQLPLAQTVEAPQTPVQDFSATEAVWLFVRNPSDLDQTEQVTLAAVCQASETARTIYQLVQEFRQILHHREGEKLDDWLEKVRASQICELQSFVVGVERDKAAVVAGLTLPQNNGLVEGKVNKLKLIKRMGYGRAEFPLLRQRVLHAL
ncbi:ISL3 family transposase [Ktedonobacter racemifer]|uniref:Transposase IS204/IS1001/IS1096/IS1165 family protein n=1 Tax=Ktedonobacter racemifer DSM 44963 TaxID=485913 RepID=D6U7F4_KTERA|nr:ISL3 family transposase [Ktedonobacter racemifer]EFH79815.1 transposase IS204/IS1001/IS1096/IS1165 family protein [Ktedonobacter racemifer DSM 44963]